MRLPFKLDRQVPIPVAVITVATVVISLTLLYRTLANRLEARQFHSQLGQDRWVLEVFPGVKDGYFVDVGSGDGELISNTWTLELNGWKGVCIDPFPTNMARRSCQLFREVVYGYAGKTITFRPAGLLGGIDGHVSRKEEVVATSRTVELKTVTLDDVLARANAPRFIHYLSIDVEGAELEVLKGFSLARYKVGAFTIEHGFQEPKRTEIRSLLEKNGYRLARSVNWDDWYLPVEAGQHKVETRPEWPPTTGRGFRARRPTSAAVGRSASAGAVTLSTKGKRADRPHPGGSPVPGGKGGSRRNAPPELELGCR